MRIWMPSLGISTLLREIPVAGSPCHAVTHEFLFKITISSLLFLMIGKTSIELLDGVIGLLVFFLKMTVAGIIDGWKLNRIFGIDD